MTRSFRSEWIKLRRPGVLLTGAAGIAGFSVLGVVLGMRRVDRSPDFAASLLSQHDGFARLMANAADFLGIVGLGIAAFAVASEYSNGTIRNLLVREPGRLRMMAGKAAALATLVGACVVLSYAVSFPVALAVAPSHGIDTSSWTSASGIGSLLGSTADMLVTGLGFALLGGVLGLAFRSPAPAIVAGIAYMIPVEALLVGADGSMRNILYAQQLDAIASGGTAAVAYGTALAVAAAWAAGAAAVSAALMRRRDVVA